MFHLSMYNFRTKCNRFSSSLNNNKCNNNSSNSNSLLSNSSNKLKLKLSKAMDKTLWQVGAKAIIKTKVKVKKVESKKITITLIRIAKIIKDLNCQDKSHNNSLK